MAKYAIFTMDVEAFCDTECLKRKNLESYDQMFDGIDNYLALLDKYNIKADLFVVANIADQIQDKLSQAILKGHKIAIHGLSHTAPLLLSTKQFKEDITQAKVKLENMFNTTVLGYRAPCFSIDDSRLDSLNEIGLKYDSSYLNNPLTYNHGNVKISRFRKLQKGLYKNDSFYEFSIPKINNVPIGGGGYVRLLSWPYVKRQLKRFIKNNDIYLFYLHPFEVSNVELPKIKRLKSYDKFYLKRNKGEKYIKRIEKIINILKKNDFEFVTFEELIEKKSDC
jgi:peptidoglycan/xylan/chitin deacetylase (PgdA/CDA1 family)